MTHFKNVIIEIKKFVRNTFLQVAVNEFAL